MTYDYHCNICGRTETHYGVPYPDRLAPRPCLCGGAGDYVFPLGAASRVNVVESYFDEGLGVDVHGERERKEILRARGLVEAGDPVGGARNFDNDAPHLVGRLPPKGLCFADWQRKSDNDAVRDAANMRLGAVQADGTVIPMRLEDGEKRLI